MKPFEIFKTGTHTSEQGEGLTFTDADLDAIASGYDRTLHEAPIVVGHPKTDAPAYGWVGSLTVRSGRLVATPADVDAAFAELVRDKKFKSRSAAFYKPDHPNNPKPGQWYLRHVGFLGAAAPAVKGLKPVEFADDDAVVFADLEFADGLSPWTLDGVARLFRGIRDYILDKDGIEIADKVVPQWGVDDLVREAADVRARETSKALFSEPTDKDTDMTKEEQAAADAQRAELEAREKALKDNEAAFAEREARARAAEDAAFVDGAVKAGRLPLGLKGHAVALFADLSDGEAVTFSDGAAEVKMSPRAAFRDFLGKLPLPVVTDELARGDAVDFEDTAAVTAAIKTEIQEARARGEDLSPAEAAARIQQKGK